MDCDLDSAFGYSQLPCYLFIGHTTALTRQVAMQRFEPVAHANLYHFRPE